MAVVYKNTFGDLLSFHFYHYVRSPSLYLISGAFVLLMAVTDVHQIMSLPGPHLQRIAVLVVYELLLVVALAIFWMVVPLLAVAMAWISKKNQILVAERTVQLRDDSIVVESVYYKTEIKWKALQKLARTQAYIYLYTAKSNAIVIPRRAFQNVQAWDEFFESCEKYAGHGH